jgi:hypothetical protein
MAIVAGFDVHRAEITFDALDAETGEVTRGRIDSTPAAVARWVARFAGREVHVAVEACTGWLFVCDALAGAGATPHLAEPVEARALRGRKRRAKTDREDARWLRELLADGRLREAWIPPEHVRQWRSRARLRHTLIGERTQWMQRIQATLFHHGIHSTPEKLRTREGRAFLERLKLPVDARERIQIALAMVDAIEAQLIAHERLAESRSSSSLAHANVVSQLGPPMASSASALIGCRSVRSVSTRDGAPSPTGAGRRRRASASAAHGRRRAAMPSRRCLRGTTHAGSAPSARPASAGSRREGSGVGLHGRRCTCPTLRARRQVHPPPGTGTGPSSGTADRVAVVSARRCR